MNNLALELKGFTKFLTRAGHELISWYGSHCQYDAAKIAFMASKEWDGMADLERKPFIKCKTDINSYFKFLMQKRYNKQANNTAPVADDHSIKPFHPCHAQSYADDWRSMTKNQQKQYSAVNTFELGMDHVIQCRNKLHQMYSPRHLHILECILKTKPKWPTSSRIWFLRTETQYIHSAKTMKRWDDLSEEEKNLYERCAELDSKRYALEKNAWVTKIIGVDLDSDDFCLQDFELSEVRSIIDSLGSIVELSKDLPQTITLKRPREAFSLFIEAYQYQIRESRTKFQFGKHLRDCSEAWKNLSDDEKQFYRDESKKLKAKRREILKKESRSTQSRLSVPIDLFSPSKVVFGPCRPSHLYPKIPPIHKFWASTSDITEKSVKPLWDALDVKEKAKQQKAYEEFKAAATKKRQIIDDKHKLVKKLLRESKVLESLKFELGLIGQSKKVVKNLYD